MTRFALIFGGLVGATAFAGSREDVLRVVPDDAGFCILVTDLRGTLDRIQSSPFARRFLASPIGNVLLTRPEAHWLAGLDQHLRLGFQSSWAEFRDEIAGDAFALAFIPGPAGKPEGDAGLFALRARDPQLLARMFERLNSLQRQSGELTLVERREHHGVGYWLRRKKDGGDEFAATVGPMFLLSDREQILRAAIDRTRLTDSPRLATRLARLGVDRANAVWWFNPRAFDSALKHKAATADQAEAPFLASFVRHWQTIDDAALHLRLGRDVELALTVASTKSPTSAATSSAAVAGFPPNAILVAGSRLSFDELVRTGSEFLSSDARAELKTGLNRSLGTVLGRDAPAALLAAVGPDWGLCVAPPDGSALLPTLAVAVKLRNEGDPPAPHRALDGLDFAARLIALAYNGQNKGQLELRTIVQGDVSVRIIEGDASLPPGLRPAFAWKRGYLIVASSPDAIARFEPLATDPAAPTPDIALARLAVPNLTAYVRSRRNALAALLAAGDKAQQDVVASRLDSFVDALELFDSVELSQRDEPGHAMLILRIKPTEALDADLRKKPH